MPENYVLLRKITLTSTTASITFSGIPSSGYTDLKFVTSARSDAATLATGGLVAFNGITANFSTRYMYGTGSSVVQATGGREFGSMPGASATANTFSSSEAIIPNYLLSNVKGYSVNTVTETNGAEIYAYLFAGVWADTAAINSITYSPASGSFVAGSSFCLYGLAAVGTTPAIAPFATGGDTVTTDGTYWIHTFLSSGTFTPKKSLNCDYLVVAGGGGGGNSNTDGVGGGGGGAGGLRSTVTATGGGGSLESPLSLLAQGYAVTIGAGGAALANGSNSVFSTITSTGGGAGAYNGQAGSNGGSGGGGGAGGDTRAGGTGTSNQGFAGGTNNAGSPQTAGGGGGAGAIGGAGGSSNVRTGGNGVATSISGSSVTYAGGGGGGGNNPNGVGSSAAGGTGGGGASSAYGTGVLSGVAGTANLGAGGGAALFQSGLGLPNPALGGAGGSGIVIVRYPIA
jgi:hypothetical protein